MRVIVTSIVPIRDTDAMQALKLEPAWGLRWILRAWRMFRKQPFGFMATLFLLSFIVLAAVALVGFLSSFLDAAMPGVVADLVKAAGGLLVAALTPALTVGFMQACRVAELDLPVHPMLIFAPLRAGRETRRRLLGLGLIQVVAVAAIVLVTSGPAALLGDDTSSSPPATTQTSTTGTPASATPAPAGDASAAIDEAQMRAEVTTLVAEWLAYLPVALVLWYAPMLIAWHGVPVGKSIFFSIVGVWRNLGAFLVYGVSWVVIWMAAWILLAVVVTVTGAAQAAALIISPLAMLLATCMYCASYQTYSTVYIDSPKPDSPEPDAPPTS
jgi:hypothetical protein